MCISKHFGVALGTLPLLGSQQASAAIRTHGTLQNCIVTIGDFCPVESIGVSLLGTACIAGLIFGVGWLIRAVTRADAKRPNITKRAGLGPTSAPPPNKSEIVRFAPVLTLMARGEYLGAYEALEPFLNKGDADAQYLLSEISARAGDRGKRASVAAQLLKSGDFSVAFKYLIVLAREGDTSAQYTVGLMYNSGTGTNRDILEALRWLSLAAKHGDVRAVQTLAGGIGEMSTEVRADVEAFVKDWQPVEAT